MALFVRRFSLLLAFIFASAASADSLGTLSPSPDAAAVEVFTKVVNGSFTDTWDFTLASDAAVGISITNPFSIFQNVPVGKISWDLDGTSLTGPGGPFTLSVDAANTLSFQSDLTAGVFTLTLKGASLGPAAYAGGVSAAVAAPVPVPAAVWLLGSALVGMVSIRRRAA